MKLKAIPFDCEVPELDRLKHVRKDTLANFVFDIEADIREVKDYARLVHHFMESSTTITPEIQEALCHVSCRLVVLGETMDQAFEVLDALSEKAVAP